MILEDKINSTHLSELSHFCKRPQNSSPLTKQFQGSPMLSIGSSGRIQTLFVQVRQIASGLLPTGERNVL